MAVLKLAHLTSSKRYKLNFGQLQKIIQLD